MRKATFVGKYHGHGYDAHMVYLVYSYRGHEYTVEENLLQGNNPCWSRNPERVMVWLCDGWRTRFNQRREQRPHNVPVKDEAGEIIGWLREPLGGSDVPELISDRETRLQCL